MTKATTSKAANTKSAKVPSSAKATGKGKGKGRAPPAPSFHPPTMSATTKTIYTPIFYGPSQVQDPSSSANPLATNSSTKARPASKKPRSRAADVHQLVPTPPGTSTSTKLAPKPSNSSKSEMKMSAATMKRIDELSRMHVALAQMVDEVPDSRCGSPPVQAKGGRAASPCSSSGLLVTDGRGGGGEDGRRLGKADASNPDEDDVDAASIRQDIALGIEPSVARNPRIRHIRKRLLAALAAAHYDPSDGKWAVLSTLVRMGAIAGGPRWLGARVDGQTLDLGAAGKGSLGLGWCNADTEEEWSEWEARWKEEGRRRAKVEEWTRRVAEEGGSSEMVVAPEEDEVDTDGGPGCVDDAVPEQILQGEEYDALENEIQAIDGEGEAFAKPAVAARFVQDLKAKPQSISKAKNATSAVTSRTVVSRAVVLEDPLKDNSPLGFAVSKRIVAAAHNASGKPSLGPKYKPSPNMGRQPRDEGVVDRDIYRGGINANATERPKQASAEKEKPKQKINILDVSDMSFPPPSFPASQLVTSTPRTHAPLPATPGAVAAVSSPPLIPQQPQPHQHQHHLLHSPSTPTMKKVYGKAGRSTPLSLQKSPSMSMIIGSADRAHRAQEQPATSLPHDPMPSMSGPATAIDVGTEDPLLGRKRKHSGASSSPLGHADGGVAKRARVEEPSEDPTAKSKPGGSTRPTLVDLLLSAKKLRMERARAKADAHAGRRLSARGTRALGEAVVGPGSVMPAVAPAVVSGKKGGDEPRSETASAVPDSLVTPTKPTSTVGRRPLPRPLSPSPPLYDPPEEVEVEVQVGHYDGNAAPPVCDPWDTVPARLEEREFDFDDDEGLYGGHRRYAVDADVDLSSPAKSLSSLAGSDDESGDEEEEAGEEYSSGIPGLGGALALGRGREREREGQGGGGDGGESGFAGVADDLEFDPPFVSTQKGDHRLVFPTTKPPVLRTYGSQSQSAARGSSRTPIASPAKALSSSSAFGVPSSSGYGHGFNGGNGGYNSQFDVRARVEEVDRLLEKDVDFDGWLRNMSEGEAE